MTRLYLMVGIPGSGKSTWISNKVKELEPEDFKVISRDGIRFAMLKPEDDYFKNENAVFAKFIKNINDCIALKIPHVFIDATHISKASRTKVLNRLRECTSCALSVEVFFTSLPVCLARNSKRIGRAFVPSSAVTRMAEQFEPPVIDEFIKYNFAFVEINNHIDEGDW